MHCTKLTDILFDHLHSPILNCDLYAEGAEGVELANQAGHGDMLPSLLFSLLQLVGTVLRILRPRAASLRIVELDEASVWSLQ